MVFDSQPSHRKSCYRDLTGRRNFEGPLPSPMGWAEEARPFGPEELAAHNWAFEFLRKLEGFYDPTGSRNVNTVPLAGRDLTSMRP